MTFRLRGLPSGLLPFASGATSFCILLAVVQAQDAAPAKPATTAAAAQAPIAANFAPSFEIYAKQFAAGGQS